MSNDWLNICSTAQPVRQFEAAIHHVKLCMSRRAFRGTGVISCNARARHINSGLTEAADRKPEPVGHRYRHAISLPTDHFALHQTHFQSSCLYVMDYYYVLCCSINPIERISENYLKRPVFNSQANQLIAHLEGFVDCRTHVRHRERTYRFDAAFESQELADAAFETVHGKSLTISGLEYKTWCMIKAPGRAPEGAIVDKHTVEFPASSGTGGCVYERRFLIDKVPADRPLKLTLAVVRNGSSQTSEEKSKMVASIMEAHHEEITDAFEDEEIGMLAQEYRQTHRGQQQAVRSRLMVAAVNLLRRVTVKQQDMTMDYHGQVPETALYLLRKHITATESLGIDAKLTIIVGKALHSPGGISALRITLERHLQSTNLNWMFRVNKFEIRFRRDLSI